MKKTFETEREGQTDFFDNFRIDYANNDVLIDSTDGVWNGNLFEFKLQIDNLNRVLFQAIKYLSKMRIKGESVPANILLVSLNTATLYLFHSQDYFEAIHKIYYGASSRNNEEFIAENYVAKYDYSTVADTIEIQSILKSTEYMPVLIDENCIVGWAERFYRENPKASKGDFLGDDEGKVKIIGEIREPKHFKGLIIPYTGKTNEKFKYLMDKLNDRLKKKDLGAFFTPVPYCEKAAELVRMAIARVPEGNDYVIIDRCAGTGNLESVLTDEELSHCILSTYEYYEYKVLCERLGDKVRFIIPPTESLVEYSNGCIMNADALSQGFVENEAIMKYVHDSKCTIIMYENPPYRDDTSGMTGVKASDANRNSFVLSEMKKAKVNKINEMANRFIWSAFKYYLRQPTDSYILFSPIKYWKMDKLVSKKFIAGFVFNRKYFHASPSAITCILWGNETSIITNFTLKAYDIDESWKIAYSADVPIRQVFSEISSINDKRKFTTDSSTEYCSDTNGALRIMPEKSGVTGNNIIGYFVGCGFGISNPNLNFGLTRLSYYHTHGFHLRIDNYQNYLPILAIKHYLMFERPWYESELICCSADKGTEFMKDKNFLHHCFIFAMLDYYNKCLSIDLPDRNTVQNELCFDTGTLANTDLQKMILNDDEKDLINLWKKILSEAKATAGYDPHWKYGVYQITKELNTFHMDDKTKIYDYPELNGDLIALRTQLKKYYKTYITPLMFKYELIK